MSQDSKTDWAQVAIGLSSLAVVVVFSLTTWSHSRQLKDIENQRRDDETLQQDVQGFVAIYFSANCQDRLDLIDYPMDEYYTLSDVDRSRVEQGCPTDQQTKPPVFVVDEISIGRTTSESEVTATVTLRFDSEPEQDAGAATHRQDGIAYEQLKLVRTDSESSFKIKALREVIVRTSG